MSKQTVTLSGEDAERVVGMLRSLSGEFEVDLIEDTPGTGDFRGDVVFYLDRIASHLARQDRKLSKLTQIESKLSRMSISMEQFVIIQKDRLELDRERLEFEREQAKERALHIQK